MHDQDSPFHHSAPYATGAYEPSTGTPYRATYLGPEPKPKPKNGIGGAGAGLVGIGLLLAKFKAFFSVLLGLKWLVLGKGILISGLSFFASIWFYTLFWGWKFAIVFVLMILLHEVGHMIFMRAYGVPTTMPFFIPGLGAFVSAKARPASPLHSSYIALGGPLLGGLAAAACYGYGVVTENNFWIACAYTGFFLNLFNLLPIVPLDGGTVVAAISPRIWIFGLALLIGATLLLHLFSPILILILIVGIPTALAAWRRRTEPDPSPLTVGQKVGIGVAYFALIGFLGTAMAVSHIAPHA